MTKEAREMTYKEENCHDVTINIAQAPPFEVNPGVFINFKVRVICSSSCNMKGQNIKIIDQEGLAIKKMKLVMTNGVAYETDPIVVKAPVVPGEYTWTAVFSEQENGGNLHEEASTSFTFTVKSDHKTSIAVWDVASPVVMDSKFKIKVGVRCSADCNLIGKEIEICDQKAVRIATEKLGETPWPDTGLYWTEVELKAPDTEGCYTWQVKFPKPDIEIPHLDSCTSFGFVVVNPPDCTVTVEVIDKETRLPISKASISLHPYRTKTDGNGRARLDVAKGEYQLYVTGVDYEMFKKNIIVTDNLNIESELAVAPVMSEDG